MVALIQGEAPAWAKSSGYGDGGYGYGYGSYGYGYGSGTGTGYGDGGYGYGYGSYGYGSGTGTGYGDGGYGYGSYGYGYGSGTGTGSGSYWLGTITHFAAKWPEAMQARLAEHRQMGATIAFWRSDQNGRAANGGRNDPVAPGTRETAPGPLRNECGRGQLHATLLPPKWKGQRLWIVALLGEVKGDEEKYWALEREIIGEAL